MDVEKSIDDIIMNKKHVTIGMMGAGGVAVQPPAPKTSGNSLADGASPSAEIIKKLEARIENFLRVAGYTIYNL